MMQRWCVLLQPDIRGHWAGFKAFIFDIIEKELFQLDMMVFQIEEEWRLFRVFFAIKGEEWRWKINYEP